MKNVFLMSLGFLALNACATGSSFRSGASLSTPLQIETHTAGDAGFRVNSHLILGRKEALLVDAQFTRSEARHVAEMVRASGRALKTILITHAHPDHYLGLEVLVKDFPQARVVALPEVVQEIRATGPDKLKYWKALYKEDLADSLVVPEPFQGEELSLEGTPLELISLFEGESAHAVAVFIPSSGALLSGDALYAQVHLWLAEDRPQGWLEQLDTFRSLPSLKRIYPGHGPVGGVELIENNAAYIRDFLSITGEAQSREEALQKLKALYPSYALPVIAELSVQARVP